MTVRRARPTERDLGYRPGCTVLVAPGRASLTTVVGKYGFASTVARRGSAT